MAKFRFEVQMMAGNQAKIKQPFDIAIIPEDLCQWAGKVALTWSTIEQHLDRLIEGLHNGLGAETPGWKRLNFRKRKKLCRDLARQAFEHQQGVLGLLSEILGKAADLHWRRNLIVHGNLSTRIGIKPTGQFFRGVTASGIHNGNHVNLTFIDDELEGLFYEIGHVSGRLKDFLNGPDHAQLPLPERVSLRDFLDANLPILAKPEGL